MPRPFCVDENPPVFEILVSECADRVWVNGPDGSSLGRFSKVFGMDIHRTAAEQISGLPECLHCKYGRCGVDDWRLFRRQMEATYGVELPADLIGF